MKPLLILLLILFASLLVAGKLPRFDSQNDTVIVDEGKEAVLRCTVRNRNGKSVAWTKGPRKEILTKNNKVETGDLRLRVENTYSQEDWNLIIVDVRASDAGTYHCEVDARHSIWKTVTLTVTVPAKIIVSESSPSRVTALEGSHVELFCKAEGLPEPKIHWYRQQHHERRRLLHAKGRYLKLANVSRHCEGMYECRASNGKSHDSHFVNVIVQYPPYVWTNSTMPGQVLGGRVVMLCYVNMNPRGDMYWTDHRRNIIRSNRYVVTTGTVDHEAHQYKLKLEISQVRKEDFGSYTCVAENKAGSNEYSLKLYEIAEPLPSVPTNVIHYNSRSFSAGKKATEVTIVHPRPNRQPASGVTALLKFTFNVMFCCVSYHIVT